MAPEQFKRYPEKAAVEQKESELRLASDFEDKDGNHPEITVHPEKGLLLFDIDGTLIHANPIHGAAIKLMYQEKFGIGVDPEEYIKHFGLGEYEEQRLLMEHYQISYTPELITECQRDMVDTSRKLLPACPTKRNKKLSFPKQWPFLNRPAN